MAVKEVDGYFVGQRGWIDVLDSTGKRKRFLKGEIICLIPTRDGPVYALIETPMGTGVYRLW